MTGFTLRQITVIEIQIPDGRAVMKRGVLGTCPSAEQGAFAIGVELLNVRCE